MILGNCLASKSQQLSRWYSTRLNDPCVYHATYARFASWNNSEPFRGGQFDFWSVCCCSINWSNCLAMICLIDNAEMIMRKYMFQQYFVVWHSLNSVSCAFIFMQLKLCSPQKLSTTSLAGCVTTNGEVSCCDQAGFCIWWWKPKIEASFDVSWLWLIFLSFKVSKYSGIPNCLYNSTGVI